MADVDLKSTSKMTPSRIALFLLILLGFLAFDGAEGQCTIPEDLRGTWFDSVKGSLQFDNHTITGYDIYTFGQFTLTCYSHNSSTYIFQSNSFFFFSLNFTGYFCWSFTKVNDDLYYFYEHTEPLRDAGYEKVKMYLPFSQRVDSDICHHASPGLGTYRLLYRNGTLSTSLASATCPSMLQKYYTFGLTLGGADLCSGTASLDGCTSSSSFVASASNCTTALAYSAGGSVSCLLTIESSSRTYMTLVNNDATVDNNSTFTFTCLIIDTSSSPYQAVQYPTQCPDDVNTTYVTGPGAYVTFTLSEECPTNTTSYLWVIGLVLAIILLIAAIVCVVLYRKKKQDDEMKRKLELERAEDDTRYTEDENFNTRGKYPPSVTIAIMEGRSRGLKDMRTEEKEKGSFRTTGDVTPSGIQPSYDGPHRKFSKRRRVWVIGEDGSVVKEFKESKNGRDSPDSGVEDEEEGGERGKKKGGSKSVTTPKNKEREEETDDKGKTKTGVSFVPVTKDKGQEQKDFQKQYGRQDVRGASELTERGDMTSSGSKLFSKIRRMAGIKSFARKKRNRGAKSAKMYKHKGQDDGEGHSSDSSNSDSNDNNRVVELKPQGSADKEKKGGKKSDKGRDSPDSGTGRDSALSSHSSSTSSSTSSSSPNDRSGGAGGVGSGGGTGGRTTGGGGDGKGAGDRQRKDESSHHGKDKSRRRQGDAPSDNADGAKHASGSDAAQERSGRGFERSARGGRVSRSRSDKSGLSGHPSSPGDSHVVSRSSGFFGSEDGDLSLRDVGHDQVAIVKGNQSGSHVTGSGAETTYYGAGHDNLIQVTPRADGKDPEGGGSNGKGKRNNLGRRKREDSTISAIDLNSAFGTPVESSRPPTGHQRRHGWQDDDSSRSRSRSRSRSPGVRRQESEDKDPAPSERTTESRSVRWPEEDSTKPGTAESGRRSVRWQDGSSPGSSLMIPLTSGMGIRRYPDSESGATTPSRDNRAYSSLSRLARLHKKKKAVAPLLESPSEGSGGRPALQRPPDMDDLEWKRLLEELYPDKKYLDYAKATSEKRTEEDAFLQSKADQGLTYLYDRARFWKTQEPLVRPGTSMSIRSVDSRAPSAVPPSSRVDSRAEV